MWSNLVFSLVHLYILISAEWSMRSSFPFTAQHSYTYFHLILILLLTSACEPPSLMNSDPMYLKDGAVDSLASMILTGFFIICGAWQVLCLCSAELQPMTLKHNSPYFQVYLYFLTSHSTQHQVVREPHCAGWILLLILNVHYYNDPLSIPRLLGNIQFHYDIPN